MKQKLKTKPHWQFSVALVTIDPWYQCKQNAPQNSYPLDATVIMPIFHILFIIFLFAGTSDEHITVVENLRSYNPDGAILVTTPQVWYLPGLSDKLHFLWVYWCKPHTGCLGEHEKKLLNPEAEATYLQAFSHVLLSSL